MDPHTVNAMGMHGGMSMPMAGANGSNPQAMTMGINGGMAMNAYGVPQQQQMMMNMGQMNMGSMAMKMNPNAMNPAAPSAAATGPGMQATGAQSGLAGTDWRIQLTREHRANLIAKIYNEMVRVSADPVPGIKLWMNVSWYELTLYKESRTQEEYINKIFTRLKSLRAQQTDMNAVMAAQTLPNQGMLSRLDFSYYNTLNLNQRAGSSGANGGQVGGFPGHQQFGGPAAHPGAQQPQQSKSMAAGTGGMPANPTAPNGASTTPRAEKPEGAGIPGDVTAEYWRQHAALKSKYHDDVEKVHSAFKKYVDHMKGHDETEQKKKLRYLLSYVQLCASILNENKTSHAPRKIEELDKVYKYIVKIVNPYLKKLRTETDKRSFTPNAGSVNPAGMNPSTATNPAAGAATTSVNTSSGPNGAMLMHQQYQAQPQPQQNLSLQQKQQQYLMQQRAQQMQQQQQRMQVQARQQQMMQQQHMMQQQQKGLTQPNQAQLPVQQANQANLPKQQQNGQPSGAQQTQQTPPPLQQLAQQVQRAQQAPNGQQQPAQSQQPASQQQQQTQQQHQQQQQSHSQQLKTQPQQQQAPPSAPTSRAETSSLSLDDSLYGGMDSSGLLQMPSNLGSSGSSSGFMNFPNDLSPTNFSSMDLLDMDGFMGQDGNSSGSGGSGQNNSNSSGGSNTNSGDGGDSDLMFMEAL